MERIGGSGAVPVDFRLICATHRDLKKMVEEGSFRQDLYYRLAVVSLRLPPLRERRQDIPPLVRHFVADCAQRFGILPPEVLPAEMAALCARDWSGNVRELRNAVEEAVALAQSGRLTFRPSDETVLSAVPDDSPLLPWDAMVKRYLEEALRRSRGRIQGTGSAAEMLELNPTPCAPDCAGTAWSVGAGIPPGQNQTAPSRGGRDSFTPRHGCCLPRGP